MMEEIPDELVVNWYQVRSSVSMNDGTKVIQAS